MTKGSNLVTTLALAGRRIDAINAKSARFPETNIGRVRDAIRRVFLTNRIAGIVCAAACGADLLALEVARDLELEQKIVLPFDIAKFREQSVVDRPGNWGEIYDSITTASQAKNEILILGLSTENQSAYEATNQTILDQAVAMSEKQSIEPGQVRSLKAMIVWEGRTRGDDDVTAAFAQEARRRGFEMLEVITI